MVLSFFSQGRQATSAHTSLVVLFTVLPIHSAVSHAMCLSHDPYPPDVLRPGTPRPPNEPVVKPLRAVFPGRQPLCFHSSPQLPPPLEPKVLISAVFFARPHVHLTYASFCDVAPVRKSAAASGACGHTPSQPLFVSASACQSFPRELMFFALFFSFCPAGYLGKHRHAFAERDDGAECSHGPRPRCRLLRARCSAEPPRTSGSRTSSPRFSSFCSAPQAPVLSDES